MVKRVKALNPMLLVYLAGITLMLCYVFLLFETDAIMDFEADSELVVAQYKSSISTAKEGIYHTIEVIDEQQENERNVSTIDLENIKYNSGYSQEWVNVTNESIKYIMKYQTTDRMKNEDWSPIFIMALAMQEFSSGVNEELCLFPSIPTKYMKKGEVTVQAVSEINYADYIKLGAYNSGSQYRGPLQMSPTWGVNTGTVPEELSEKSEAKKCDEAGVRAPSNTRTASGSGDRCNWPDICNMFGGVYRGYMDRIKRNGYSSKYELCAIVGLAHNVGPAVISGTTGRPGQSKFCWKNYNDCRSWLSHFSDQKTVEKIRGDVHDWLMTQRNKGIIYVNPYSFRSSKGDTSASRHKYADELMDGGYLPKVSANSWEAVNYAVYIVAYYCLFEEILSGV